MSEEYLAYNRIIREQKEENEKFWSRVACRDWKALRELEQGRIPSSTVLTRFYTKENMPDETSEKYKAMRDHVEKLYKFDELD